MRHRANMKKQIERLASEPAVASLLGYWEAHREDVVKQALEIQAIPAPTFEEQARGEAVAKLFADAGLADVEQDKVGNVYGRTVGADASKPALLVSAHLDTVFPRSTDLTTRYEADGRIYGAGLGDNSLGVAALLGLMQAMQAQNITPPADIWWVATVGEEGLGDLRGIRRAVEKLDGKIGLSIILEGIGLGWIYNAGLGVRRLRVTVTGPGGHSWLHPAPPSAIHQLLLLGAALVEEVNPPDVPRSSFNIGLIDGGTSINTRAPKASLSIDMRSVDRNTLQAIETRVRDVVRRFTSSLLEINIDVIGDRPSARLSTQHPLVVAAQSALNAAGAPQANLSIGSTDANIPLSKGIPSVCVGISTGGNPHTVSEYIETTPITVGMKQLTLLTLLAARNTETWCEWQEDE